MADGKIQVCKDCKETRIHWAHGLCHRCYMKKYRKDHGINGIADIKEKAYEHMAEVVNSLLVHWNMTCEVSRGDVVVEYQGDRKRRTL